MLRIPGHCVGRAYACLCAALSMFAVAGTTNGQVVRDWINPAGGSYDIATHWNPANVPDSAAESARFNLTLPVDVLLASGATTTVSDLLISAGDVTFAAGAGTAADYVTVDDLIIASGILTISEAGGRGDVRVRVGDDLDVNNGGSLMVELGSQVTTTDLFLGTAGSGTTSAIVIDGAGTTFDRTGGGSPLGQNGAHAILTFRGGAMGDLDGTLSLAGSNNNLSAGTLHVESDADLELDSLNIGASGSSTVAAGTVNVLGAGSTITQTGASTLTIGTATGNLGRLNISTAGVAGSGGTFSTGTGLTLVRTTGEINIGHESGRFNANGDVMVDGGRIFRDGEDSFNLAAGKTLTASNDAHIEFVSNYSIRNGMTFDINSGADFSTTSVLNIGALGGDGTLVVDGEVPR